MSLDSRTFVSVLTPVYNGDAYLAECIESVLAQTYGNWEYIILDNASTDGTLTTAQHYASRDQRIKVYSNDSLLDIISNHNKIFRMISPEARYCKIVSSDDWLFPSCLAAMVELADANPSVGIVGSYQMSGGTNDRRNWSVRWDNMVYSSAVVSGRAICRSHLLGDPYAFGTPTSLMYRADLVRAEENFYPNLTAEADTSAVYKQLQKADFGFVHQVLSYERDGHVRTSTHSRTMNAYALSRLADLLAFGPNFLTENEQAATLKEVTADYYAFLAACVFERRGPEFWAFHRKRLQELGRPMSGVTLATAVGKMLIRALRMFDRTLRGKVRV